jgi:hypothetical protein
VPLTVAETIAAANELLLLRRGDIASRQCAITSDLAVQWLAARQESIGSGAVEDLTGALIEQIRMYTAGVFSRYATMILRRRSRLV